MQHHTGQRYTTRTTATTQHGQQTSTSVLTHNTKIPCALHATHHVASFVVELTGFSFYNTLTMLDTHNILLSHVRTHNHNRIRTHTPDVLWTHKSQNTVVSSLTTNHALCDRTTWRTPQHMILQHTHPMTVVQHHIVNENSHRHAHDAPKLRCTQSYAIICSES